MRCLTTCRSNFYAYVQELDQYSVQRLIYLQLPRRDGARFDESAPGWKKIRANANNDVNFSDLTEKVV